MNFRPTVRGRFKLSAENCGGLFDPPDWSANSCLPELNTGGCPGPDER